jgi:hypothetical protein
MHDIDDLELIFVISAILITLLLNGRATYYGIRLMSNPNTRKDFTPSDFRLWSLSAGLTVLSGGMLVGEILRYFGV